MSALLPITVLTAVLTALLHLVIDGVGVALAIVFWRRARPAAILTLIACAAAVPVHLLALAWRMFAIGLPALIDQFAMSLATVRALNVAVFLVSAIASAGVWALLFSAVFAGRRREPVRP